MSIELEGYNFEAYPHFRVVIDGFTSLTGEGHSGKSTILRALRAVLLNEFEQGSIRDDAKESLLRVTFHNEPYAVHKIERKKSKDTNAYEFTMADGTTRKVPKAGKVMPKELEDIGFSVLRTEAKENNKHDLTFHQQFDAPLFLLQLGEASAASFINTVYGLNDDEAGLARMVADSKEVRQRFDRRAEEILSTGRDLASAVEVSAEAARRTAALEAALSDADAADYALQEKRRCRELFLQMQDAHRQASVLLDARASAITLSEALRTVRLEIAGIVDRRNLVARQAAVGVSRERALAAQAKVAVLLPAVQSLHVEIGRRQQAIILGRTLRQFRGDAVMARARLEHVRKTTAAVQGFASQIGDLTKMRVAASLWGQSAKARSEASARFGTTRSMLVLLKDAQTVSIQVDDLRRQRHALRRAQHVAAKATARNTAASVLPSTLQHIRDSFAELSGLVAAKQEWSRGLARVEASHAAHRAVHRRMVELREVEISVKDMTGACPTCHKPLLGAHAHG